MKKLYPKNKPLLSNKNFFKFLITAILLFSTVYSSYGQVVVDFTPRTSSSTPTKEVYNVKGDFTMIGNTNLTVVDPTDTSNFDDMRYVDIDDTAVPGNTTFNSSSAYLDFSSENGAIPECSNIIYAGLYWTGRAFGETETDPGTFDVTKNGITKTFDNQKVSLKGPNSSDYLEITALDEDIHFPATGLYDNMYAAYAEITSYVQQNGIGEYFVADIATKEGNPGDGTGYYGGWGMVVIYENSKMKWRDITVFDGYAYVASAGGEETFTASGFNAAQNGDVNLKLGVMAGEGDLPWTGDYFQIETRNTGTYVPLSHSGNTAGNFFNSSIETGGNLRNPNYTNNTGVDIAMFNIDNTGNAIIDNNQTSTSFNYGSTLDTYIIFNVTFAVDAYVPETEIIVENISNNPLLDPGDPNNFTIEIKNTGTEATNNTTLRIPLPVTVDPAIDISDLTTVVNINPAYAPLANYSDPVIINNEIVWNMGTLPVPANPDDVIADISFSLTVTTDCSTLISPAFDPNDPAFDPYLNLFGTISGMGDISNQNFEFDLIQGFVEDPPCIGEPIKAPLKILIDYEDYVNEPPTAICQDITIQLDATGNVSIVAADIDNGSNDNCGTIALSASQTDFNCTNVGDNTVVLTVTDIVGNVSTCSATVTVEDNINPTAICQDITVQLDADGDAIITAAQIDNDSSDACGIKSLALDDISFTCSDIGDNTRTLTVTDNNDNVSTCTATITVEDNVDPTAICQNITAQLDASGNVTITAADIDNGSNDACGIKSLALDTTTFTCANIGDNTVVLTVTDNNDNVSTCSATVTVEDNVDPTAICQSITAQLDASGNVTITTADIDNGSNDACGIKSLALDTTTFTCANIGDNTVVLTVTDNNDNVSTCSATVTVEDNVDPNAICQNITAQLDASGNVTITTADIDNGSNDACGIASLSLDTTSFGCGDIGNNTVTLTVTDNNGNVSTCTATVDVQDNTNPTAICQNATVVLDAAGNGSITTADIDNGSNDACGIKSFALDTTTFTCANIGDNTVVLTVTDNNDNVSTCSATVTVEDNVDPNAICQNITAQLDASGNVTITTADIDNGSNDACGIASLSLDTTSFGCGDIGNNTVTLTVTDNNGNVSTCTATVDVQDNTNPTAICQNATVVLDAAGNGSITTADIDNGSNDACGIASLSLDTTSFGCGDIGNNTVTLTVTDNNGNVSTCTATVDVQDNTNPTAICQNATVVLDATGNGSITTADIDNGSNDACGIASLSLDTTSFGCGDIGNNTVTLTVTDNNGNVSTCTATVDVQDNTNPTAICQNATVVLDATGNGSITTADIDNGSNDACGIASLSLDTTSFGCGDIGNNTVTLTVTDNNGNVSTCTATVDVQDNTNPTAICQNATVVLDAAGNGSITTADIDNGSNDACGIKSFALDTTTFTCANIGDNTVVLTVTDINDNVSTCSATVTVEDNVDPTAICQNITAQLDTSGNVTITAADIDNGSNDACGIKSLALDTTTFTCANIGDNTVILTVTDNNDNISTCLATVTVEDNVDPTAICQSITAQLDASGNVTITTADIDNGSNDACGIKSLALDTTTFTCANIGDNTVVLTVTDNNDNVSTCSATVTVEDNVDPTFTIPSDVILFKDVDCFIDDSPAGDAGDVIDEDDNCSTGINATYSDSVTQNCEGTYTITRKWSLIDNNNNSALDQLQTITVSDNTAPTFIAPDDIEIYTNSSCSFDASTTITGDVTNEVDNCSTGLEATYSDNIIAGSCEGTFIITRTWSLVDNCSNPAADQIQTITVSDNTAPTFTAPIDVEIFTNASCIYDVDIAFTGDVTDEADNCSTGIEATYVDAIPVAGPCEGTFVITRTWSLVDNCSNAAADQTQTITISDNIAPTGTTPSDISGLQCIADVTAADIEAVTDESDNCSTSVTVTVNDTNNGGTGCNGDPYIVTRTYTLTDCGGLTTNLVQTITVEDTTTYTGTAPTDITSLTCDYADQDAVDTAFNDWVTAQSAAITAVMNGCSPVLSNNSASITIPELCAGGIATVEWTITDLCKPILLTADFIITAPVEITYTAPADDSSTAAVFDDPDASIAQANLDSDIAAWVATQNDAIINSIAGGCNPQISNDFVDQSISFCNSNSITITWTVQDLCETTNPTATYTFTQPDGINFTNPSSNTANACDFDDDNVIVAQADLDADIQAWVNAQNDVVNNSLIGGSPEVSNDFSNQSIDLCSGGSITITWTIEDICETLTPSAIYTLTPAATVTYTDPVDANTDSCDFTAQTDVNTAFNNWVNAQSLAIAEAGGCSPVISNDSASATIPMLCTGGSATVTWTITDLCETITLSADFNLAAAVAVTYNNPGNINELSCDFADQGDVDIAFNNWVTAQSAIISQAGGCAPVLSNDSASVSIPMLCSGGSATVTWTITDLCETNMVSAEFNLTTPVEVTYNNPVDTNEQSCDFADQAAVDTAFNNWVTTQSTAIAEAGGCSPVLSNNSASITIPELCTGGSATVTWTITDLCETITASADFNLTAPAAITFTNPANANELSCDFADQAAVDTAFNDWLTAQSNTIGETGCDPVLSNDSASVSIPELCTGGSATVTWTITDLCETTSVSADFNLTEPVAITYNTPLNSNQQSCNFADQAAVATAFNNWVTTQSTAIAQAGGCSPVLSNNSTSITIPELCTGGTVTVEWTITDLCETIPVTAEFTITTPIAISYTDPVDDSSTAAEFDDPDASIAQANLDADIVAWVAAQNDVITNSIAGGCNPQISNDFVDQSINFCNSGSITITWTIQDLCETTNPTATYTYTQPDGINFINPSSNTANACDFDNDNPSIAQTNLDADIAAWVATQNDVINNSLTGGSPEVSNNFTNQSIDLCTGGSITITWTIEDICETLTPSATYTLTPAAVVTYTDPIDANEDSCDFTAQADVNTAFNDWVTAQSLAIAEAGGCSPILSNDNASASIPMLCAGGSTTVTWTITDLCETITLSADFNLLAAPAITYNNPVDTNEQSCDFADQGAIDIAFSNWVNAQSTAMAQAGGCNPLLSNNSASMTIPELCAGGSATVTWTITDLCETITVSANFNLTEPAAITFTNPVLANELSCDFADQAAVDTAFNDWVNAQSTAILEAGGCDPVLSNDSALATIPELCNGGSVTVTWTITDLCDTIIMSADFNLSAPVAVTYNNPVDANKQSCDFADQTDVDTAFNDWVTAQSTAIGETGCSPALTNDSASASIPELCAGGSVTVTWTITDLCETNTVSADFNLTAPDAVTYNNPTPSSLESCDFADQAAIDTVFNNWVTAQSTAIAEAGGCSPVLSNNSASITIPELCAGGTVTVEWTITDLCETIPLSAEFIIIAPVEVTYIASADVSSNAAEFDDPDASVAQANLDADIVAWVAAQTDVITNSIAGGCAPQISNDFVDQSINFCNSDSITITWTVQDLCETTNPTATYTFIQPDSIGFTSPNSITNSACDFDNDDPSVAQANLDADIATWVAAQTAIINGSLSGGSPTVSNNFTDQSIDLCTGGSITITWTIEDICETLTPSAIYTLTPPDSVTYTEPANITELSCDFAGQVAVDTAFNDWVTAQSITIAQAGGCSPVLSNNSASITIPELCTGGTVSVEWIITDLCETIPLTADFTLTAPSTVTYTTPLDDASDSCEFETSDLSIAQNNLDADIATWIANETTRINGSLGGGCNPMVTNDFVAQSIDFCTGGSISINWTITDLCETINVSALYTFTQPEAPTFMQDTLPADITVECDAVPAAEALTASNTCGDIAVNFTETITDGSCPNAYSILRTWTATNICGTSVTNTQTIIVEDNTVPVLTLPADVSAECSDDLTPSSFGTASAVDNCDADPIVTFNDVTTNGECSGTFTITRTWTATDACGNVTSADQIISTIDTTAPEFDQITLPGNIVVECDDIPDEEILTATDNCGIATVSVEDVRIDGNCANSYTIARTYTATDECGVINAHVQTITVQDSTPPVFVETLPNARIIAQCDAIPIAETLTATDTCGSATVTVSDARTNGNCPNNYTLARTWVATDLCGLTTTYTQIIVVQDTTPPTFVESLPRDTTVECDDIPGATTLTAIDNCGDAIVTISDVRTDGNCISNYTIARTWIATDECGLTTSHTQTITVQDTTAPIPASTFAATLDVSCTDIPEVPDVEFTDNCSANVIVMFDETNTFDENVIADYQIIRTWTVRDACNNEEIYTQTLNVALDEILNEVVAEDRCFDDGVINLDDYLADDTFGGSWEIIEGNPIATVTGSIFDPTNLESAYSESFNPNTEGMEYVIRYTGFQNGCINLTDVIMIIDASCKVLPCGAKDISISTAITPNGDDYNETFDIEGITLCGFVAEVKIFNRWGALVYESNEYTLGSEREGNAFGVFGKWNGISPKSSIGNNGKLPNGTYYYIINLRNSGLDPITGPIYLGTK